MRRFANRGSYSPSVRAFTLVELLVTIGIILILSALVVSAVWRVKEKSADVQCMANLRVLGLGIQQYAADHRMRIPPGKMGGSEWFKAYPGSWILEYVMEGTREDFPSYYRCPLDKTQSPYRMYYSYSWNAHTLISYEDLNTPAKDAKPILLWQVPRTILLADGLAKAEDSSIGNYPGALAVKNASDRLSHRHHGGVNALLGDGSVRWMATEEAALPESLLPRE